MMSITVRIKTNYMVIVSITLITMILGTIFTWWGMSWYRGLVLPSIVPHESVFSIVWNVIYALTTTAAVLAFNRFERNGKWYMLMTLFCCNAFLNVYWTYLFFYQHFIGVALVELLVLEATTVGIFALIAQFSPITSLLMAPYVLWNIYAFVLNLMIWQLN